MTTLKNTAAIAVLVFVAACAAAPDTSSRFHFSPAFAPLSATE